MIYTFYRKDGFYPIELISDEEVMANVICNPGTLKVTNEETGKIIFEEITDDTTIQRQSH